MSRDGYVWHSNRHTFASRLAMAGVDMLTLKELGGWKQLSMVQRYAHLRPDHLQAAVERLVSPQPTAGAPNGGTSLELAHDSQSTPAVPRIGTPGRDRTCDLRIRSPSLCPTELRAPRAALARLVPPAGSPAGEDGVSEGSRTLNPWSHSPVLCH